MRETVIDFTVPFIEDGVGILTRRPDEEPNKIFKMFKPFSLAVWLCIGAAIIAVGTMLFIVGIVNPFVDKSRDSTPELAKQQKSLKQTVWLIYGSFVEQGKTNIIFTNNACSNRVFLIIILPLTCISVLKPWICDGTVLLLANSQVFVVYNIDNMRNIQRTNI